MKVAATLAALTLGLATTGLAYAEEPYFPMNNTVTTQSTSRAQVLNQLHQAEASGLLNTDGHQAYYPMEAEHSTESRAQVLSELHTAEAKGETQSGPLPYYPGFAA